MMPDVLQALRDAGTPVDQMSEGQKAVFAALSPEEAAVLVDIQTRLTAAEPEVEGHEVVINIFC
jgi:hypothetical protein